MTIKLTEKQAAEKYLALKAKEKRYWVRQQLLLEKAKLAGLTVTDKEIDDRLAKG